MNLLNTLAALKTVKPYMELQEAFLIAEAVCDKPRKRASAKRWWLDHDETVKFARNCPAILDLLPGYKIKAIKELREQAEKARRNVGEQGFFGLKEAKNAIDEVTNILYPPF